MEHFDLNIKNYSISELEELLTLGRVYNIDEIRNKKDSICMKIVNDNTLTFDMKTNLERFFENASVILKNIKCSNDNNSQNNKETDDAGFTDSNLVVNNLSDIKNVMMKNSNNLIIDDPVSAHNIRINRVLTPGTNVDDYGTQRGVINPLLMNTILKAVNIDTRFRENYYSTKSTNITITLPFRLEKVISYRIVGITLPLTYYNISQSYGNNVMQINVYSRSTLGLIDASYNLILPDGCYNTTQNISTHSSCLEEVINNLLKNDPNSPNNKVANLNLRYTIDRTSGRSIIAQDATISSTIAYNFEVIFTVGFNLQSSQVEEDYMRALMLRLGWILGFRLGKYSSSNLLTTLPTVFGSIVSEGICFTKFPLYGFLAIDDFNNNANDYYMSVFSNSVSVPNIIAKVNFTEFNETVGAFQAAQGESTSNAINREKRYFGPVNIQKLKITLYDDLGRVLDLNNMDWSLELAFECVYNM
jgi:hypothetical protein